MFRENLRRLIADIRADGAQPVICAQVMAAHPDATSEARSYLGATDEVQRQNAALGQWLHAALRDTAARESVLFIDAYNQIPATTETLGDAIHLTPEGEQQLADLLATMLRQSVSRQGRSHAE